MTKSAKIGVIAPEFPKMCLKTLSQNCEVAFVHPEKTKMSESEIANVVREKGLRGIIVSYADKITPRIIEAASDDFQIVSTNSVGYDHLRGVIPDATREGIALTHAPGVLTNSVAELTMTMMGIFLRPMMVGHQYMLEGKFEGWRQNLLLSPGFEGTVLGIVGMGRIGAQVARLAQAYDMEILYNDINPKKPDAFVTRMISMERLSLRELLKRSDVVTLHVDLNETSRGLIGMKELGQMKETAGLINTSRGPVVKEDDLVKALETGVIGWAALDVYEKEPAVHPGLLELGKGIVGAGGSVLLQPHLGSGARRARLAMADQAVENLLHAVKGEIDSMQLVPELDLALKTGQFEMRKPV